MKNFKNLLNKFVDFCLCLYFFPKSLDILNFLAIKGLNSIAEKFFLYNISKELSLDGDILEVGSFQGSSSMYLAEGNSLSLNKGRLWLIEPLPKPDRETFIDNFKRFGFDKDVMLVDKTSEDASKVVNSTFRFIFIDGSHDYEDVKRDILLWARHLKVGGIIAFHDRKLAGVAKAIDELIKDFNEFKILGSISGILYASKGNCKDVKLISKIIKLNAAREKLLSISRNLGLC